MRTDGGDLISWLELVLVSLEERVLFVAAHKVIRKQSLQGTTTTVSNHRQGSVFEADRRGLGASAVEGR